MKLIIIEQKDLKAENLVQTMNSGITEDLLMQFNYIFLYFYTLIHKFRKVISMGTFLLFCFVKTEIIKSKISTWT